MRLLFVAVALLLLCVCTPRRKVCILMVSTPDMLARFVGLSERINRRYAERHGYKFVHRIAPARDHADAVWKCVGEIRKLLNRYDAVFYIDGDAAFDMQEIPLDRWLDGPGDIVACSDRPNGPYHINAGTLLVKATPWSLRFLDKWAALQDDPKYAQWAYEQEALHDLIERNDDGEAEKINIRPAEEFNSVYGAATDKGKRTFVVHLMSRSDAFRRRHLQRILQRLD